MLADKLMDAINNAEIWLPSGAEVAHEARIIQCSLPEGRGPHTGPAQEGFDFS